MTIKKLSEIGREVWKEVASLRKVTALKRPATRSYLLRYQQGFRDTLVDPTKGNI